MVPSNSAITSTQRDLIGTLGGERTQKVVVLNGNFALGRTTKGWSWPGQEGGYAVGCDA